MERSAKSGEFLKPNGRVFISDLRRDMPIFMKWFLWLSAEPKEMRPGLITSINAAYTPTELDDFNQRDKTIWLQDLR